MTDSIGIAGMGIFGFVIALFLIVQTVLWFLLPFAIFGTKDKLTEIIVQAKKTNSELELITNQLAELRAVLASKPSRAPAERDGE